MLGFVRAFSLLNYLFQIRETKRMAEPTDTESLNDAAKINKEIKEMLEKTKLTMDEINEG